MPLTALDILNTAPLGAYVTFSDGTPRPPERFNKKLSAWKTNNGGGILTGKTAPSRLVTSSWGGEAHFTLRIGEVSGERVMVLILRTSFSEGSPLSFEIQSVPTEAIRLSSSDELVTQGDLMMRGRRGDDPKALQHGEREEAPGYGAAYPLPYGVNDQLRYDLAGVKGYVRHPTLLGSSSATLIAVRDDGFHVEFPGVFCTTVVAKLDAQTPADQAATLLTYIAQREAGVIVPREQRTA